MVETIHVTKNKYPPTDKQLLKTSRKLGHKFKKIQDIHDLYLIKLNKVCAIKNACNKLGLDETVNILLEENPIPFQVKKIRGGSVSFKGVEISDILDFHDSEGKKFELIFNLLERSDFKIPEGVTYSHPLSICEEAEGNTFLANHWFISSQTIDGILNKENSTSKGINEEKQLYDAFSNCSVEEHFNTFLEGINERYIWACQEACAVMYQWLKEDLM